MSQSQESKANAAQQRSEETRCCQSAKVGHFETREGYCYKECRASSLRVLL